MSGYEGSHQDWLEDQASDQLEREAYDRSRFDDRVVLQGDGWEVAWAVENTGNSVYVSDGEDTVEFPFEQAVLVAHAILSEVEIAQRADFWTPTHFSRHDGSPIRLSGNVAENENGDQFTVDPVEWISVEDAEREDQANG